MSKGGSFNVIINKQNPDDLINNNRRMLGRLAEFYKRSAKIVLDPENPNYISMQNSVSPIINYLEQTHHVFVNGSFKPHIPIAYQYTKYAPNTRPEFGGRLEFDIKPFGDFWADMVLHVQLTGLRAKDNRDRVRYIAYPGHRFGSLYQFYFQSIKMDEYDYNLYNIHRQFHILPEKIAGWDRCVGQEVPINGFMTPDPTADMYREYRRIGNGAQTLKQRHDILDLWIPILFWFRDIRYAFPQIIPDEQTRLAVDISPIKDLVGVEDLGGGGNYIAPTISVCNLYVNNLFMQEDVFQLFLKNFNFSLIRVNTYQRNTITSSVPKHIKLYNIKYPVENLFVGFRPQSNLSLSQYWHKYCKLVPGQVSTPVLVKNPALVKTGTTISADTNKIIISGSGLSAVNDFYAYYVFKITNGAGYFIDDIQKNIYMVVGWAASSQTITVDREWSDGLRPDTSTTWEMYMLQPANGHIQYYEEKEIIDSLELRIFDISVRGAWSSDFYSKYIPYHYGTRMASMTNPGIYIIPFNIYPLSINPSGYIDFTQSRENYLYWTSQNITSDDPVDLIIYSRSINFLIIYGNTASLRYTL
jgi:hypothetical protein